MDKAAKKDHPKESGIRSFSKAFTRKKASLTTPVKNANLSCVSGASREDIRRHSLTNGVEFNYVSMEDELTCPVCLELYADPLMLPCRHNLCKKCLHDINNSTKTKNTQVLECPSCREYITRSSIGSLPRNLALENIVIRYSEERSRSIRNSLSLDGPLRVTTDLTGPGQTPGHASGQDFNSKKSNSAGDSISIAIVPSGNTSEGASINCELCDTSSGVIDGASSIVGVGAGAIAGEHSKTQTAVPNEAAWYCEQCRLAYCHACLSKYHPKRGVLARHIIKSSFGATDGCQSLNTSMLSSMTTGDSFSLHSCTESDLGNIYGQCSDHSGEHASLYCAKCKTLICPLCVCDGEGQHSQHRVLAPNTAANKIQETVRSCKTQVNNLLQALSEQNSKIECLQEITEDLHKDTVSHLTRQYDRLLSDLTAAVQLDKAAVLSNVTAAARRSASLTSSFLRDNSTCVGRLRDMSSMSQNLSDYDPREMLLNAEEALQLSKDTKEITASATGITHSYDAIVKDKTAHFLFHESLDTFCTQSLTTLRCLISEDIDKCPSIIPHIRSLSNSLSSTSHIKTNANMSSGSGTVTESHSSSNNPSTPAATSLSSISSSDIGNPSSPNSDVTSPSLSSGANHRRRTQIRTTAPTNKYLTTWGFTSTSFTGEPITGDASWTVTVERNGTAPQSSVSPDGAMYLFGAGISCDVLGIKAMVGMGERSYAVVCSGGNLCYSHNGRQEHLAPLPSLPLVLTISVHTVHPKYTVLTYKLCPGTREMNSTDGTLAPNTATLVGRRIINDAELKTCLHPAFTVSQRVKMLFHTFV